MSSSAIDDRPGTVCHIGFSVEKGEIVSGATFESKKFIRFVNSAQTGYFKARTSRTAPDERTAATATDAADSRFEPKSVCGDIKMRLTYLLDDQAQNMRLDHTTISPRVML
jgi:hypothetical protein